MMSGLHASTCPVDEASLSVLPATAHDLVLYIKYKLGLINVVWAKFNDSVTIGHRDSEINDPF